MGVSLGTLDRAQIERWRAALSDAIATSFAYPPFFDYPARTATMRPVDRAKRNEIDEFVRSANLEPVERLDVSSPEVRRFIERLFLRYLEVNPALAQARLQRRLPQLRSYVPRAAADTQRALKGHAEGGGAGTATQQAQRSWSGSALRMANEGGEHNTRVLEAVLARGRSGDLGLPSTPIIASTADERPAEKHHVSSGRLAAVERARGLADAPTPTPGYSAPLPNQSPFAGLETGSQSTAFANLSGISDIATGPLVLDGAPSSGSAHRDGASGAYASASPPRELPPDLYRLYGDYLRDMQPEAPVTEQEPAMDAPTVAVPAASAELQYSYANAASSNPVSSAADTGDSTPTRPFSSRASAADARGDQLIFWQLRYQLEAYVRDAARGYGVTMQSGDPSGVLDALRRSGFVDESDLRIAEGILALTDRVTSYGTATVEDYRQALTLYLLYHRSHLGA
jgi:hypothetical protein